MCCGPSDPRTSSRLMAADGAVSTASIPLGHANRGMNAEATAFDGWDLTSTRRVGESSDGSLQRHEKTTGAKRWSREQSQPCASGTQAQSVAEHIGHRRHREPLRAQRTKDPHVGRSTQRPCRPSPLRRGSETRLRSAEDASAFRPPLGLLQRLSQCAFAYRTKIERSLLGSSVSSSSA